MLVGPVSIKIANISCIKNKNNHQCDLNIHPRTYGLVAKHLNHSTTEAMLFPSTFVGHR